MKTWESTPLIYPSLFEYEADRAGYERARKDAESPLLGALDTLLLEELAPTVLSRMRQAGIIPPFLKK